MSYSTSDFLWMVNDAARIDAYAEAIRHVVRPGDRVVDLGCGFGYLAVLCCQAGASHVDAIDVNPAIVFGPRIAAANGCDDRIAFHHADARRVQLAARADVIVGDLRGPLPLAGEHLAVFATVRDAMLRPGGTVIARRDTLWMAPCVAPATFREDVLEPAAAARCELGPLQHHLRTVPYRTGLSDTDLLGAGVRWGEIDYATVASASLAGEGTCVATRDGALGGVALWFDAEVAPQVGFSNAPGTLVRAYRQLMLPLLEEVPVRRGDALRFFVRAAFTPRGYVWSWRGTRDSQTLFDQNSLVETILDPTLLPPAPDAAMPPRGPSADALQWLLGAMGSGATVRDAVAGLIARWPALFASERDALAWVQRTLQRLDREERGAE